MTDKNFRVLLIYPNTMMATLIPISVSILSSVLKKSGFNVELFDATYYRTEEKSFEERKVELLQYKAFNYKEIGVSLIESDIYEDLNKKVEGFKPNLIGVTIVEDTYNLAKSLLKSIRNFNIPVIAGGVFVTLSPEEVIENEDIDMLCIGEGEETLVELCNKMKNHEDYTQIKNLWVKNNGNIIKNPLRKLIDLNKLPYIDYDVFAKNRLYRPMMGKIYTMIHIEIDRGCPYECTYCSAPTLRKYFRDNGCGIYFRSKTSSRIIEEIRYLVNKYNPDYINFDAECFLARSEKSLRKFAEEYTKIGLPFWCQSRPETITEEKIKILKSMNCANLNFGIECGNEEFRRKILNRYCSNEQIINGLKLVEKYKIPYTVNNIIGFPDETRELIFDTININRQINPKTINCTLFTPFKGTWLYNYCLEKGYITKDSKVHQFLDSTELKMNSISYQELKGLQRTFVLYARLPESYFGKIKIAEKFDDEGNKAIEELKKIYYEKYVRKFKYKNNKNIN